MLVQKLIITPKLINKDLLMSHLSYVGTEINNNPKIN